MPMDFLDMKSLQNAAKVHGFRKVGGKETEQEYRIALADHVASIDFIESEEIRNGIGWDKWSEKQKSDMLKRKMLDL